MNFFSPKSEHIRHTAAKIAESTYAARTDDPIGQKISTIADSLKWHKQSLSYRSATG